jgi:D-glycero-alpha-D-manno-heptose-7-phosphate kinase
LQYLQDCLLFYFTGFSRLASDIAGEQIKQTPNKLRELRVMKEMVDESVKILNGRLEDMKDFGKLLHESWKIKRSLSSKISKGRIDEIYDAGLRAGALGGKICGAGGGGFIVFFVLPEKKENFKQKLNHLLHVPFRFEHIGTHVIYYSNTL